MSDTITSPNITFQNRQMAQVLAKIIADKQLWLEEQKQSFPYEHFQGQLQPAERNFYDALSQGKTAFILECKKASPSKGLIRDDFDLDYIASTYADYANVISVLTDEKYFQGSFEFLPKVKALTSQPILCKDFIIDPYQIYLARSYQADAILLMLSVLDDAQYDELSRLAHSLNMGVLTEVSNQTELERAIALNAKVIGINNRNLRDLSIDLNRTKVLAPQIPKDRIIISESGIHTHQQVRDLAQFANGFLIGSSLMAESNLEQAVRKVLLGENKVCGLTSASNAHNAYQAGAIYGGLIFVEKSPRYINIDQAKAVINGAPLSYVGVFQNHDVEDIVHIATSLCLSAVQLHGNESQCYVKKLRSLLPHNIEIWKAYGVQNTLPKLFVQHIDKHLFDAQVGTQLGGTGESFDWQLLSSQNNILLAGGIGPDNAKTASELGCLGLDINSGVESSPGEKDQHKLQAVFAAIKDF